MCGRVFNNDHLCSLILEFTCDEYLFTGTINKACHNWYRKKTKKTSVARCFQSISRVKDSGIIDVSHICPEEFVYRCDSIEVMHYSRETMLVPNLNGALEHAIRSKNRGLIAAIEGRYEDARVGPACLIAAVESGSLELVKRYCADGVLDRRAQNFGLRDSFSYPHDISDKATICDEWRFYVGEYLVEAAKRRGFVEILSWLHSQDIS
ncbi:unnamed protein product [Pylaiella littoralis]